MNVLLYLFVAVSVAATAFELFLHARQAACVARHRDSVPADFADTVTLTEHQRAADYERAGLRLDSASSLFSLLAALVWVTFGYDALYGAVATLLPGGLSARRGVSGGGRRDIGVLALRSPPCAPSDWSSDSASTVPDPAPSSSTG